MTIKGVARYIYVDQTIEDDKLIMQTFTLIWPPLLGIALLYAGAELLVLYATRLALSLNMTPLVVGLTVVAFCTSTPELASTLAAQLQDGLSNVVMGTIVGSNIANIGLILGVVSLIKPLKIDRNIKVFEAPVTLAITALLWICMLKGHIGKVFGIVLVVLMILYVCKHIYDAKRYPNENVIIHEKYSKKKSFWYFVLILIGVALLAIGGAILIKGSLLIAKKYGVSDRVIGLTIVALGTALPEFAASIVALYRKLDDIAIGNIIGSNIFNLLFILGCAAIIKPIEFSTKFLSQDMPALMIFSLILWALVAFQQKFSRISGLLLVSLYGIYLVWAA